MRFLNGGYALQIKSFQIENYKCLDKTDVIPLTAGINLVLGRNNVGKTALLECLEARQGGSFSNKPHLSLSITNPQLIAPTSKVIFLIDANLSLPSSLVNLRNGGNWYIKTPQSMDFSVAQKFWNEKLVSSDATIEVLATSTGDAPVGIHNETYNKIYNLDSTHFINPSAINFTYSRNENTLNFAAGATGNDYVPTVYSTNKDYVYKFSAERLNLHEGSNQDHLTLLPNAQNLAGALNFLQTSNPHLYSEFCTYIHEIFPNVFSVNVLPKVGGSGILEIKVWSAPLETRRNDLSFSLKECGTGISQVLAILFLIMTSDKPRVIIIDEPNSFLHPGAVKKLIEIIKRYPQHQYIISTHSPEVIKTAEPNNVLFLTQENGKTNIECVDLSKFEDQSRCLQDIGVSLSDVFSADSIIWVEGPTEEVCFPLIMKQHSPLKLGLSIIAVKNTGDFDKKSGKEVQSVTEVYTKLSQANALIPRAVGFVFDSEGLTQQSIIDKKREMGEKVEFLSRRMFENYLLNAEAITHALNKLPSFQTSSIEVQAVNDWILANGNQQKYKAADVAVNSEEWLKNVHSASLLEDIFSEFSTAKEEYKKTRDSVEITKWLLANKPDTFSEIIDILKKFESKA